MDVAAEFRDILSFHLGAEPARLGDDARLGEDLGADSLDLVEIMMSCEERFSIDMPNRSAGRFTTVGEAVRFVEAQVAATGSNEPRRYSPKRFAPPGQQGRWDYRRQGGSSKDPK